MAGRMTTRATTMLMIAVESDRRLTYLFDFDQRRMRHEGEQHSPRQRRQERQHQLVQLVGHQGQEAEEEELHQALAIHFLRRGDPPLRARYLARNPSRCPRYGRLSSGGETGGAFLGIWSPARKFGNLLR